MKKFLVISFLFLSVFNARAMPESDQLMGLLGRSILDPELYEWIQEMNDGPGDTILEPRLDLYSLEFYDNGVALDFTVNFHLKGIRLFDTGSVYSSYLGDLPFGLKYDMGVEQILADHKNFTWSESSPFEITANINENGYTHNVITYLRDNRIEMIDLRADYRYVRYAQQLDMVNWRFRLFNDGDCLNNACENGVGTMDWGQGAVKYTGKWQYSLPNGQGVYLDTLGNAYKGEFLMGFFWGRGEFEESGIMRYKGDFMMGTRTGTGTANYTNGFKYEGEWLNNLFHGKGTYYQHKGYVYKGSFASGQFNGYGKLLTPAGYYEGFFKNGKPHGEGVQYSSESGNILSGEWVDGKKEGEFEYSGPGIPKTTLFFKDDQQVSR